MEIIKIFKFKSSEILKDDVHYTDTFEYVLFILPNS